MFFDPAEFVAEQHKEVAEKIGDAHAVIAVSGGVDSSVAAEIVKEVVGDKLHAIYVDTGFMRKDETEEIEAMYKRMGLNLTVVHAADEYFEALAGVTDPEQKRKIIGEKFIRIFEREAKKTGAKILVQGTIAPDWIESGGGNRDTIKSHHNVGTDDADGEAGAGEWLALGDLNLEVLGDGAHFVLVQMVQGFAQFHVHVVPRLD